MHAYKLLGIDKVVIATWQFLASFQILSTDIRIYYLKVKVAIIYVI